MDNALNPILELSRDPVLVLEGGKIVWMNSAARQAFPGSRPGDGASELIPDLIAFDPADRFLSAVVIGGVRYTVSAARCGGALYLSLEADCPVSEDRGFLSAGTMSGMLAALFNVGLSSERLRSALPQEAADARKYLAALDHSYYTLLRRIGNLNTLISLGDGSMELALRRVDLAALCSDIASSTALLTRGAYAPVEFVTELDTLPACMDARRIEQLVLNLLANSLRHTPADGRVRLKLAKSGSNALISVSDNGSGIPPAQLNSIFTGFPERRDIEALCAEPGGGIGLGLCRMIAEKHGGTLILESREGEGTDVRVLLPLMPPGMMDLMSAGPAYSNGGMTAVLTELSELLDAEIYRDLCPE